MIMSSARGVELSGAGATFPEPLYQKWVQEYNKLHPDVQVNYQSIGSGAGIKQFTKETVDFGASDAAMTDEEIARVKRGTVLIPMTAGSIVLAYNLPGITNLRLSRAAYTGIFLGSIQQWDERPITVRNPGVSFPKIPIWVAHRYDGSGTTFVFSKHLCLLSPEFKALVGEEATQVSWPVGVGGKWNEGVTALIKQRVGTIGYVEYGYAVKNKLPMAALENKSGNYIQPSLESGSSPLDHVAFPENLRAWPDDPVGPNDYPITTFTWLLLYKSYPDKAKLAALKDFILYAITDGQKYAPELGYVPLPPSVVEKVKTALDTIQ